ncbi:MAG TPA: HDIG domain-containing protein [Longimicrobiaceae bacterium]|nr:HDIG domain-containing protein [Longimicrobiaceae bacterium]
MRAERRGTPRRTPALPGQLPEPRRPARVLHHGLRFLLLLSTALAVYFAFPPPHVSDAAALERGMVAPADVIAGFSFQIPKDRAELRREQEEAARSVPPVYDYRPAAADSVLAGVRSFFAPILSPAGSDGPRAAVLGVLERSRIAPTRGTLDFLADPGRSSRLLAATESAVRKLFPLGVAPGALEREGISAVRVRGAVGGERLVPVDSLLTPDQLYRLASAELPAELGPDAAELQRLLLIRFFRPSLVFNEAETDAARARARPAVDPVAATVLAGEKIVGAREQIGEREEARLRAYQVALAARGETEGAEDTLPRALGSILFNVSVLGILGVLLWLSRRHLYDDLRSLFLLALLLTVVAGTGAVIARTGLPHELIPFTFAVLIVATLWGGRLALSVAFVLAILIGGQTPFLGVTVPFTAALTGAAAAFSVRAAQRRSQTWLFVVTIAVAYAFASVTIGLLRSRDLEDFLHSVAWGVTSAGLSSVVAIGFLPLLESLARVTTDAMLLELSDTNRPLLRRLQRDANGTFHHTINVANLAEAACHAIGANALLARVGAYYHDIGKVVKPQYFIENQPRGKNPHDKLKPAMSAAIVRSHVVEGLRLADEARLPEAVKAFIREHHGTQPISFFYERAREADPDGSINPQDFTYLGPKPRSRETAVLMLADSVESAAHVLTDHSPDRLREMVERIVAAKVASGQLDDCPLTLRDIQVVKEQLARVLAGMYHHRIDYPTAPREAAPEAPAPVDAEGVPTPAS